MHSLKLKSHRAKSHKAFSLLELAIVGVIISILITGIMQSRSLSKKAKIANARSQTANSPVMTIGDLVLWYETTSEKSFLESEAVDGSTVSTWYDLNPDIETVRNNATQTTPDYRPVYQTDKINGLPTVSFTRANSNFMSISDISELLNNNYTIFVVEQRTSNATENYFIAGTDNATTNGNLHLGYKSDTLLSFSQWSNDYEVTHSAYSVPTPLIHSYNFDFDTKEYYLYSTTIDGSTARTLVDVDTPAPNEALTSFTGASLGKFTNDLAEDKYYQGDIGEVIIFKKHLKTEDRKAVENYLVKKWNIRKPE